MKVGHTANILRNMIIIFGGELHKETPKGERFKECTNEIKLINVSTCEVRLLKQTGMIDPRKNHCSFMHGRYLLIHGGINYKRQYLNDLQVLDTNSFKWT